MSDNRHYVKQKTDSHIHGRIQMCLYSDMTEKQKELATKFKDHLEKKYGKKATFEEAHL